ncbi:MAG TPA: cytochrome b N-terminal domain-containing protein [Puia sp.]|jgi:ubiquinol-cytochrome c reductase cytochrome b subunit|nr:cytochrome b N-terminal domain-containing protein [Puia sp.]
MKNFFGRIWHWLDDRMGIMDLLRPLIDHPVPPRGLWMYVFGSATLFMFILQVVTGVALSLLYQPSSDNAYHSLQFITYQAKFGNILRSVHFYGASAMIILVGLHMIRTYITASYKFPREMNWISGVFLLLFTIFMGFTGQLLRWDSNGVWSSVVAAQQLGRVPFFGKYLARLLLGGDTIGSHSLTRFFSYHVFIIPAFIFIFIGLHLWLVFKTGISEPPKAGRPVDPKTYRKWYDDYLKKYAIPFWPNAAWRDVLFSSFIVIAIILFAWLKGAPDLTTKPDMTYIHTSPQPDWYMVLFFALFALMPHKIESAAMTVGPLLTVIILFVIPFLSNKGERSPIRRPWAMFGVICVFVFVISLLLLGLKHPWSADFDAKPLPVAAIHPMHPDATVVAGSHLFYTRGCEYCHQVNGYGGKAGPDLSLVGLRLSAQEITIRIVNGGGNMPAYGGILNQDELATLVNFLSAQK